MAKLEDQHRRFIVIRLACFESPSQVAEAVRDRFGIDVPRQQVYGYDVAAAETTGRRIAQHWKELFWETRRRYLSELSDIAVANKAYRLRRLDDLSRRAERMGNFKLAAALLEQAAKEMGGHFTNRSEVALDPRDTLAALLGTPKDRLPTR